MYSEVSHNRTSNYESGAALTEVLAAIFVLALLAVATFSIATLGIRTAIVTEYRSVAQGIATAEIEKVNQLAYDDVGLDNGTVPDGVLTPSEQVTQNGQTYDVARAVTLVDDPQNGAVSGTLDEDSADYKQVTITITPPNEPDQSVTFTTLVVRQIPPVSLPDPVSYWSFETGHESCFSGSGRTNDDVGILDGTVRAFCANWPNSATPPLLSHSNQYFLYSNGAYSRFGGPHDPITPPIDFTNSFSISAWLNPNFAPNNQHGLAMYGNDEANSSTFEWYITSGNVLELLLTDNALGCSDSAARQVFSDPGMVITSGSGWQHAVVVYDSSASTVQHFVDGVGGQVLSVPLVTADCGAPCFFALASLVNPIRFGSCGPFYANPRSQTYYQGAMDDVRIYDQALDSDQVRFLSQGNI